MRSRWRSAPGRPSPSGSPSARPRAAEAHRRVDRAAAADRGDRAAAAEMADDEPRDGTRSDGPLHGEAVEAVAADAPVLAPAARDRVGRGPGRDRRVEGRVEDGDLRERRQRAPRGLDRRRRRARCGTARAPSARAAPPRPRRRPAPARGTLPAVDDPVRDDRRVAGSVFERGEPLRAVAPDDVQLQAGRARVHDDREPGLGASAGGRARLVEDHEHRQPLVAA